MIKIVLVLAVCVICVLAQDSFENAGVRVALKLYDDCSKAEGFSPCLKKKAITFLDRLGRMDKLYLTEGITIIRAPDTVGEESDVTEEQLEKILPRSAVDQDDALNSILFNKIGKFIGSRTLEITMPKFSAEDFGVEQGRKGSGGGGGGGGGKGGMKGMMGGMMMGVAAKMAAMIPVAIAGLFLLAGKALITAKIALLLSGIIAIKKLFGSKNGGGGGGGGGGGHGHGWQSSGHGGGGWQSGGGGGGWDKRSIDDSQQIAYNAYSPK